MDDVKFPVRSFLGPQESRGTSDKVGLPAS